jgi:hypothetical protein
MNVRPHLESLEGRDTPSNVIGLSPYHNTLPVMLAHYQPPLPMVNIGPLPPPVDTHPGHSGDHPHPYLGPN